MKKYSLKKLFFISLLCIFCSISIGYAQDASQNIQKNTWQDNNKNIHQNVNLWGSNDFTAIRLRYCNDSSITWGTKTLLLDTEPMKETPICVYLINRANKPLKVKINFVDGTITQDSYRYKACKQEHEKEMFWQYVSYAQENKNSKKDIEKESKKDSKNDDKNDTTKDKDVKKPQENIRKEGASSTIKNEKIYTLDPQSIQKEIFNVIFPDGYAGKIYWCATLSLVEENKENDAMFSVFNRIWYPIEAVVKWDIILDLHYKKETDIWKYWIFLKDIQQEYFHIQRENDEWIFSFAVINSWNIRQEAKYTLNIDSFFHKNTIITGDVTILPWDLASVNIPFDLPWWDIPLTINLETTYQPVFDFESDAIKDEMKTEKKLKSIVTKMPIFSLSQTLIYTVVISVGFLVIGSIILIVYSKRKRRSTK